MKKAAVLITALILLTTLGVSLWPEAPKLNTTVQTADFNPEPSQREADTLGTRDQLEAPSQALPSTGDPLASAPRVDDASLGNVVIQTVWERSGEPAAGITILASTDGNVRWSGRHTLKTDHQGRATIRGLAPGTLFVSAIRGGESRILVQAGETLEESLEIPRGLVVQGIVTDPDGVPLADAGIWLSEPWRNNRGQVVAQSDPSGKFLLPDIGGDRYLAAYLDDYIPSRIFPLKGEVGSSQDLHIVLSPGSGRLRGQVIDPQGNPIANADLLIGDESRKHDRRHQDGTWVTGAPPRLVRSDAEGQFELAGMEPGPCEVQAKALGFAPWRDNVHWPEQGSITLEVQLQAPATLRGRVTDTSGAPVAHAQVVAGEINRFATVMSFATADGEYRLHDLGAGPLNLNATGKPGKANTQIDVLPGQEHEWNPRLEALDPSIPILRGQLFDHLGEPLAHWRAVASTTDRNPRETVAMVSDEQGRFELNVPWENFRFWAHGRHAWDTFPPILRDDLIADGRQQIIRAADPQLDQAMITGRILDAQGLPLAGQLQVWHVDRKMWRESTNDSSSGEFEITAVPSGRISIELRPTNHPWTKLGEHEVSGGQVLNLGDLTATPGTHLEGTVSMTDGSPLPHSLRCDLFDSEGQPAAVVETNTGRFQSGPLTSGIYRLRVQGDHVATWEREISVDTNPQRVDIRLRAAALRELHFELPRGIARPRAVSLHIHDADHSLVWSGGKGPVGDLHFKVSVPSGRYTMRVYAREGLMYSGELEVTDHAKRNPMRLMLHAPKN